MFEGSSLVSRRKEGKHYRHALKRLIHYKRDILAEKDLVALRDLLAKLKEALESEEQIYGSRDEIERAVGRIAPPPGDVGWRENVEVFLVAIVIAAGVGLLPAALQDSHGVDATHAFRNRRHSNGESATKSPHPGGSIGLAGQELHRCYRKRGRHHFGSSGGDLSEFLYLHDDYHPPGSRRRFRFQDPENFAQVVAGHA